MCLKRRWRRSISPRLRDGTSLRENGRSVTQQAPLQNDFRKGDRGYWRGMRERDRFPCAGVLFCGEQRKRENIVCSRRLDFGVFCRKRGLDVFAALLRNLRSVVGRFLCPSVAARVLRLCLRRRPHHSQGAMIRENEPTDEHERDHRDTAGGIWQSASHRSVGCWKRLFIQSTAIFSECPNSAMKGLVDMSRDLALKRKKKRLPTQHAGWGVAARLTVWPPESFLPCRLPDARRSLRTPARQFHCLRRDETSFHSAHRMSTRLTHPEWRESRPERAGRFSLAKA